MTKSAIKEKPLTQAEAKAKVLEITKKLLEYDVEYTFRVKRIITNDLPATIFDSGKFGYCFTVVKDCDKTKIYIPKFTIREDERMRRYAELIISYE